MTTSSHRPDELTRLATSVLQPGFEGTTVPDWLRRRIAEGGLRSVVLFGRNISDAAQVARLTAELRAENPDLLIGIDEEAGDVTRLEVWSGATRPGNLALGAADDVDLTEAVARDLGGELRAAGISLNYAPSADVNSNPRNPVIGVRSFGAAPDLVARHTAAWVRGLQSAGVAACAKHFPGHGDTAVDSHLGLPRVEASAEEIARTALPPFEAAIKAGVRAVMTAHMLVPAHDARLPATLSPAVLVDLLRGDLGFSGLVVTDAIEMSAVTDRYGIDGATVRAVRAGADAVCVGGEHAAEDVVDQLADALTAAVRAGELPADRLAEAADRVGDFATWSGQRLRAVPALRHRSDVGLVAARRAVRVRAAGSGVNGSDRRATLPLTGDPHVVEIAPVMSLAVDRRTPWGVASPLSDLRPGTTSVRLVQAELADAGPGEVAERAGLPSALGRPVVVVVRDAGRHSWMARAVERLLRSRPDAVVVEMGVPQQSPPPGTVHLETHGATRVAGIAAAEVLTGAVPPTVVN